MDEEAAKENPPADFNKIDLSQLQGFSFGTQWTQDKSTGPERRSRADRPPRADRGDEGPRGPGPNRRDRRAFHRPPEGAGQASGSEPRGASGEAGSGPRGEAYPRRRAPGHEPPPYLSPYFSVILYPEETSFTALVRTIRTSCRTIELFEIARTVLAKPERFTVVVARREPESADPAAPPQAAPPIYLSVPDGLPFESEEAAAAHVVQAHFGLFFDRAEVAIDPPKGNFPVINRCTVTGELLGPPNYHRYNQTVQRHHAERIRGLSLEEYRSRIESARDPALVEQWLEKMKKVTRYSWKQAAAVVPPAPAPAPEPSADSSAEGSAKAEAAATVEAPAPAEPSPAPKTPAAPPPFFDSLEEARTHLLTHARDKVFRQVAHVRFPGRLVEQLPAGEIRRAIEGALERQRRFPLDTANTLRGRLRREHFTIFKKGAKGVSYVCSVKRKFRVPGQVFGESIGALIGFIEAQPMVKAGELAERFLGLGKATPDAVPTPEQRERIARMQGDLHWLVHEGYVTEFIDGSLYAPPPTVEARKKEAENEEQDPENFPEATPPDLDSSETAADPPPPPVEPPPAAAAQAEPPSAEDSAEAEPPVG